MTSLYKEEYVIAKHFFKVLKLFYSRVTQHEGHHTRVEHRLHHHHHTTLYHHIVQYRAAQQWEVDENTHSFIGSTTAQQPYSRLNRHIFL